MSRDAVIFDWQGTLVNVSGIRHLVEGPRKNFPAFHLATGQCPPNPVVVEAAIKAANDGLTVLVGTGCSADFHDVFVNWLHTHHVPYHDALMREAGDFRKDVVVKREMLSRWREVGLNVVHAWDDNPNVLTLWREEGIPTTVVPGWTGN